MNLITHDRNVLIAVNTVKLLITATVLGMIVLGLVGCSSGGGSPGNDCNTAFVLPAGFPDSVDGFYGLLYNDCFYTKAEMEQLRREMHAASIEAMACFDSVYNYDSSAKAKDGIPYFPYASKIQIYPESFKGRDGKMRDIQYLQAGYFVKYHPVKNPDGTWNMWRWIGEQHTMYRVEMLNSWQHSVVYDKDLPFEGAANKADHRCVKKWKPAS